jgi:hypothetical protein
MRYRRYWPRAGVGVGAGVDVAVGVAAGGAAVTRPVDAEAAGLDAAEPATDGAEDVPEDGVAVPDVHAAAAIDSAVTMATARTMGRMSTPGLSNRAHGLAPLATDSSGIIAAAAAEAP